MDKKISLINKIIVGIIAVLGLIFYILIMMKDKEEADGSIENMLMFTYVVLIITLLASLWVWLKEMISHPEKLKQTAIFTGLFLAIIAIAKFVLASNKAVHYYPNIDVDANTSGWVDTGLYTFYILGVIAVLLMFLSPVLSGVGAKKTVVEQYEEEYEEEEEYDDEA